MSEVKKGNEENNELLGTVTVNNDEVTWEALYGTHNEIAKEVLDLQTLIATMSQTHATVIDGNPELFEIVKGLMLTVSDVAKELVAIQTEYLNGRTGLTGIIPEGNEDDIMAYVSGMSKYVNIGEKLANLSATAITDILTRLKLDPKLLKEAEELKQEIKEKTS